MDESDDITDDDSDDDAIFKNQTNSEIVIVIFN